jgi:hypothetical protein
MPIILNEDCARFLKNRDNSSPPPCRRIQLVDAIRRRRRQGDGGRKVLTLAVN